jgi:DMSO/TMAO reductase YedYZ molybdopterin-dependent catalytic subunit
MNPLAMLYQTYRKRSSGWKLLIALIAMGWTGCGSGAPAPLAPASPKQTSLLSVSGSVERPLTLSSEDLAQFPTVTARLNDVHLDGAFHGVFRYTGVPLRLLLDQAGIVKKGGLFNRDLDLAIVVRNAKGQAAVLSWGEVFYRNAAEILLAHTAEPIFPHKPCENCHSEEEARPWRAPLERTVPMPKLVATRDFTTERCLESVTSIEIVALGADHGLHVEKGKGPKPLYAPSIEIRKAEELHATIESLEGYARRDARVIQAGDGTGFHGFKSFEGTSLKEILTRLSIEPDPAGALLLSAPDGYRVLLSNAEALTVIDAELMILADRKDGQPEPDGGAFHLVIPTDLSADRWLKSVARIDVLRADGR